MIIIKEQKKHFENFERQTETLTRKFQATLQEIQKRLDEAEKNINQLKKEQLFVQRKLRRNNIVMFNITVSKNAYLLLFAISKL